MNGMIASVSPHIRSPRTTKSIMLDVIIALCPALIAGCIIFGMGALIITLVAVASCVVCEWGYEKLMKKPSTVGDLSAVVTGMLLAFNLPVGIPLWQVVFGAIVAIIVVKQLFGGIGKNFANPAITARVVMILAFSRSITTWIHPDGFSSATPLAIIRAGETELLPSVWEMVIGFHGGCLGETCALALVLGGIYLIVRKVITWHIPVAYIGTVAVLTAVLGQEPIYQSMAGGLLIGAIFMATDYTTSPSTPWGKIIFGLGCGLLTVLIRVWGSNIEGVSFAILFMNILTPYISSWTRSKPFGGIKA